MYLQGVKKSIVLRTVDNTKLSPADIHPLLYRIYSARGIKSTTELDRALDKLPSPWLLSGMENMVRHLITAIEDRHKITIVADFDVDGATSCAVAMKGLQMLGASEVTFVVPNRFEYGYGLTPEIVELVKKYQPDVIITVDNGISSIEGVKAAQDAGMKVLVTDHHLPGHELPAAEAIVNPNLPHDAFPSKALAGVGVMFYVLLALRSRLRQQGWFGQQKIPEPKLAQLLDYVALGTVADVVALDHVNRILVYQGLMRIRMGRCHPGLQALIEISGRNPLTLTAADLGFALGPRLNAAGRMDDMSLGIQCLLTEDFSLAKEMALQLDDLNNDRKDIEGKMKHEALALLSRMKALDEHFLPAGVCLFDENWHQGVIGILAARIKDQLHRPVIAFAPAGKDLIKGSARSISGVHIRDILSDIAAIHPKLLSKFGGHAMAAGLSLNMHDYPAFALAFDEMAGKRLATLDLAELLQTAATWGQEFPEPVFHGVFDIIQVRIVGQQHLKLVMRKPEGCMLLDGIAFFVDKPEQWLGLRVCNVAYKLDVNEFRGQRSVQLLVQYLEKVA
jgi:single-stranded-DNA-specific exonuclease